MKNKKSIKASTTVVAVLSSSGGLKETWTGIINQLNKASKIIKMSQYILQFSLYLNKHFVFLRILSCSAVSPVVSENSTSSC